MSSLRVSFLAEQLYYLPQFMPVVAELLRRGHAVQLLLRLDEALRDTPLALPPAAPGQLTVQRLASTAEAYAALRATAPDWAVFGSFRDPEQPLAARTRTALIYHGIGVKSVLFDPRLDGFDLRCVESQRVEDELRARDPGLAPRLLQVGFAKLDPLLPLREAPEAPGRSPVLLYAPTFYPSSVERMPERLGGLLPGARWIVKPHFFSWTVPQYAAQRARFEAWGREPGVEVLGPEHYDLVPLMARADVLLSEASSALFEFAALNRPVLWCRFLALRWSYRGLLAWRFRRRMDPQSERYAAVARRVERPGDLPQALAAAWAERQAPQPQAAREALVEHLIGRRDGGASRRIADALEARAGA